MPGLPTHPWVAPSAGAHTVICRTACRCHTVSEGHPKLRRVFQLEGPLLCQTSKGGKRCKRTFWRGLGHRDTWTKAGRRGLWAGATGMLEEQAFPVHSQAQSSEGRALILGQGGGSHLHRDQEACRVWGHASPSCLLPCDMTKSLPPPVHSSHAHRVSGATPSIRESPSLPSSYPGPERAKEERVGEEHSYRSQASGKGGLNPSDANSQQFSSPHCVSSPQPEQGPLRAGAGLLGSQVSLLHAWSRRLSIAIWWVGGWVGGPRAESVKAHSSCQLKSEEH